MKLLYLLVLCAVVSACVTQPPKSDPIPPELIPPGFTAADCRITKPSEAITTTGPGGQPTTVGTKPPEVKCERHSQGPVQVKSIPTCHTKGGKELPLSDCCMTDSGDPIRACTPKLQPPE